MNTENIERIKAKINKLFNLADKAKNEHEAANAMAKARKLMDQYQLDNTDLLDVDETGAAFAQARATRVFNNVPHYMNILATAVAQFNDCQARFQVDVKTFKANKMKYGRYIEFSGYKVDTEMACEMHARLIGTINRLCAEWLEEIGHEGRYPVGLGGKFKHGCATKIIDRMRELMAERAELKTSTGTSLVVVKSAAVAEYFGDVNYTSSKFSMDDLDEDGLAAFLSGQAAGATVQIVQNGLEGEGEPKPALTA